MLWHVHAFSVLDALDCILLGEDGSLGIFSPVVGTLIDKDVGLRND